ncbi:transcription factor [Fusarium longipes]|uniref:Transcription factor n=1 Tax=Fusarium longipes TaxID=694270 RepID=A0A395T3U7_9HYPO|nr:transcription factor [Fusarium longipes]
MAVSFFLRYVTDVGRNMESTRGFLELVRPVLASEPQDSTLAAAVMATSIKLWALLRPSDVANSLPIKLYNQALGKLQHALHSPKEQGRDSTVLAALMLQQHDTLAAIFGHNRSNTTHRKGALALLTQDGLGKFRYQGHLLGNLFHSRISFCVRHKVALNRGELEWLQREVISALPRIPSYMLDVIGISVSRLQSLVKDSASSKEEIALSALKELPSTICDVEAQLQTWLDTVPEIWHRQNIQAPGYVSSSVMAYDGSVDIYPSIQIVNIWNVWRIYCLIVEQVKTKLFSNLTTQNTSTSTKESRRIRDLLEDICRSMPFYLGNCSRPVSFTDMQDQQLSFPCYHDLPPADEAFVNYQKSHHCVSRVDHNRHNLIHGPIAALSVLSNLVGLFEDPCSPLLSADGELERQKQWIYEQFRRSLYVMRFIPRNYLDRDVDINNRGNEALMREGLAGTIRQALCTVNLL